jgi:protein-L-isoaspartate(D-aspartate) O-methyltransferase
VLFRSKGWPEHAPFNKIIVTCSPEHVPQALADQLAEGGQMIIPVGERYQQTLYRLTKVKGKLESEKLEPTLFVPMTGAAEETRRVQPDPANPRLVNGSFEDLIEPTVPGTPPRPAGSPSSTKPKEPAGWHYQRQLEVVNAPLESPLGNCYAKFVNAHPGRAAQALQGFAVDGRRVPRLEVSVSIKARNIRPGQDQTQLPLLAIIFYDENRGLLGQEFLGPWRGTFDWQRETRFFTVPKRAREAILRIGLFGATGELWVDNVEVKAAR